MEQQGTRYLVGIGGWEHEILDRCLYPHEGMSPAAKLAYYAEFFDVAEVRSTFWDDSLTAADARLWLEAVRGRKEFLFSVKLHSSFTHKRELHPGTARAMRAILQELARHNRLGSLLVQFPYSFTNVGANRQHVTKIAELFRGFPLYVEFRHRSWETSGLVPFLLENAMRPVNADLPRVREYMPFGTVTGGDMAYLRLHGRNEKGWLLNGVDTRYDYLYNGKELGEIRRRLTALGERCRQVMVVCNNTAGGKAVANALQLSAALRETKSSPVPMAAWKTFPAVQELGQPLESQEGLFGTGGLRAAI